MNRIIESYSPAASASLPLPRQAAGTLCIMAGQNSLKGQSNATPTIITKNNKQINTLAYMKNFSTFAA